MAEGWFPRFAAIPGIVYEPFVAVDVRHLPGAGTRPETIRGFGDDSFLSWRTPDGSTSASPAHERAFGVDLSPLPTDGLLRHLAETLELPGLASDYHFAIQGAVEALWGRRRIEPAVLARLEWLAWLDLALLQACPDAFAYEHDGARSYYQVLAFGRLLTLYEREGALREALEVAELADRFAQLADRRDALAARVAALDAETAP